MSTDSAAEVEVVRSVTVPLSPAQAFDLFTARMTDYWPPEHSIGVSPIAEVVVEPRVGGRWFERGADGSECDWGRVATWEPPQRVALLWQINADSQFDPDFETEVEVTLTEAAPGHTRLSRQGHKASLKSRQWRPSMSSPRLSSKRANCCCSGSSRRLTTPRRSWPDLAIPVRQSRPVPRRRMQSSARPAAWSLTQSRQRQPTSAIHSMTRSRRQRPHGWPIHQLLRASALSPPKGSRRNPTLLPVATMTRISPPKAGAPTVSRLERWSGI